MTKFTGIILLLIGAAGIALAGAPTLPAPEIDPAAGASAFALLSGAILVIRGRKK